MSKGRILIVDDDVDILQMLHLYFDSVGYEVLTVTRGTDALETCRIQQPHVVLLDIMLPDIEGYDVCRKLRASLRTGHVPIIFLTQKDERSDKIAGLELGADDYITKPFDVEELKLRVQAAMRRAHYESLTNPTTGLPSAKLIEEQLMQLVTRDDWAVLYIVIHHLDAFIKTQDIVAQDNFLRFVATNLNETVETCGTRDDFIGHTSSNDFLVITLPSAVESIKAEFLERFERGLTTFYDASTPERGYVLYTDHDGNRQQAPLMNLSIGVLTSADRLLTDTHTLAAEARRRAVRGSEKQGQSASLQNPPTLESVHAGLASTTADISHTRSASKGRILMVEDDLENTILPRYYFESQGYEVLTVKDGKNALEVCRKTLPDVILLDIMLPGMNGYDICRELRASLRTSHIPIIFLTQKDERSDKIAGLELDADDYITKPYDIEELKLRMQNVMRRAQYESLTNPTSGLPSAKLIEEQLKQLVTRDDWAVLYIVIHHLDAFIKTQDIVAQDSFLRFVATNLNETVETCGTRDDFIGHTSSNDFLVITLPSAVESTKSEFLERFERGLATFHDASTLDRGYALYTEHDGAKREVPLLSLSMSVLTAADGPFANAREIAKAVLERRHSERDTLVGRIEALTVRRNQLRDRTYALTYGAEVAEHVESFGRWTTGIIHDLRNGLEIIGLHVIRLSGCDKESLARMKRANRYAKILLETLSEIRFRGVSKPDLMRLDKAIQEAASLVRPKVSCRIEPASVIQPLLCYADSFQIEMALVNLLKFIGENTRPSQTRIEYQLLSSQDWIEIAIRPSPGSMHLPPQDSEPEYVESCPGLMRAHLGAFEPRLYVAEKVVRRHKGYLKIEAEGNLVKGCCLSLPKVDAPRREVAAIRILEDEIRDLEREVASLREQLDRYEKAETHSEDSSETPIHLFRTVAGELFNELSIIQTTADVLRRDANQEMIHDDRLFKISRSCKFCRLLVRNLLAIGEDLQLSLTPVPIMPLIDDTLEMLEKYYPPQGMELKREIAEDLRAVWATELGVQQILMNLILNALHAVVRTDSPRLSLRALNVVDKWVEIAVTDNGCGIPPENREKIFELGFTTRPGKEGGVGLSVVRRIVEELRGEIQVDSRTGQGTTFTVHLPAVH